MSPETHDAVLVFSKTWGMFYLLAVFLMAAFWIYRPSRKPIYDEAAQAPLGAEDIRR